MIVRARPANPVSGTGNQRQVGEAVRRWLRPLAGYGSRTVDLSENRRVERLPDAIGGGRGDHEVNVLPGPVVVDDDRIPWTEISQPREEGGPAETIIDVPGDRGRARIARDPAAPIPERLTPDGIAGRTGGRVHHVLRCEAHAQHGGADLE